MTAPAAARESGRLREEVDEKGGWWVVRVWMIVGLFAVVTVWGSYHVGVPVRDPEGAWLPRRLAISIGLVALLAVADAAVRSRRQGSTTQGILAVLRARWTRGRIALAATGLIAYQLVYLCYHNLKSWLVFQEPRDDMLQQWDRWLFLGHSPAVLLHDLFGQNVAAYVLTAVYVSFSAVVSVSLAGRRGPPRPDPRGIRLPRLRDVGVDPGRWCLLPDSLTRPVQPTHPATLRGWRTRSPKTRRRATWHSGLTCWPTRRRRTRLRRSLRSPVCTSPSCS